MRTSLAEWHDWYRDLLATLPEISRDDIVVAWLSRAHPNVWRLGREASLAERAHWRGLYVRTDSGQWWGPEGIALSHAQAWRDGFIASLIPPGGPGYYLRPPVGQVADLAAVAMLREHGWHVGALQAVQTVGPEQHAALRNMLGAMSLSLHQVSRRKVSTDRTPPTDWQGDPAMWAYRPRRSGIHKTSLARALLMRGLVADGMPHRAAVRTWLEWESELAGPWRRAKPVIRAARWLRNGDAYALRDFEESRTADDRQLWRALGIDPDSEPNQN